MLLTKNTEILEKCPVWQ